MTLELNELSETEIRLYQIATFHNKNSSLTISFNSALPDYKTVHKNYFKLYNKVKDETLKLEILKRLIFINWYSVTESDLNTGMIDLDTGDIIKGYKILNEYLIKGKLDYEFTWMLQHYSIWDYAILSYAESELTAFVNTTVKSNSISRPTIIVKDEMDNRGQMGIYWKSFYNI
jgi:hypothetical protein